MTPDRPTETPTPPLADPWRGFSQITAGVLLYGFLGYLVDRWLGTSFVVAIGILVGAGLGIYLTFAKVDRDARASNPDEPPQ